MFKGLACDKRKRSCVTPIAVSVTCKLSLIECVAKAEARAKLGSIVIRVVSGLSVLYLVNSVVVRFMTVSMHYRMVTFILLLPLVGCCYF